MRIQRLEIQGFKSFADRTVFHFGDGITGIVGPNGCGKSNVVDAIRWAMGEQSAKHLRGNGMDDVIFAGSESRGPTGMAEVTLTFRNDDGSLVPEELRRLAEISVTRRLFRDGTSEYMLNKKPARLRDVVDLFLGTGVGTKSYSIIEQGRVGLVVTAKPEDRRALIEEAAGITKYKTRRKQAERRLEAAEQNLLRVNDVLGELEKRAASLERQAKKATRYKELRQEQRDLELRAAAHKHAGLTHELDEANQRVQQAVEARAALEETLGAHEARVADELRALDGRAKQLEERRQRLFEVEQALAVGSKNVEHLERERAGVVERRGEAERERERLLVELADAERELELARAEAATLGTHADEVVRSIDEEERALAALGLAIQQGSVELERRKRALVDCLTASAQLDQALHADAQRLDELERRARAKDDEAQRVAEEATQLVGETEAVRLELDARRRAKEATDLARQAAEAQVQALETRFLAEEAQRVEVRSALLDKRSRLQMLEEIQKNYEGYQDGVRAVMRRREEGSALGASVKGLVADVLTPPAHLERAVEAVLGDKLQAVIVDDLESAERLVDALVEAGDGRSTFVPRTPREDHAPWAPRAAVSERPSARPAMNLVMTIAARPRANGDVELVEAAQPVAISLRPLPSPELAESQPPTPARSISDRPVPVEIRQFVDELERELRARGRQDVEISSIPVPALETSSGGSEIGPSEVPAWPDLAAPGVLGKLVDLVGVDAAYAPVARVLLGDVVVVETLPQAEALWRANGHRRTFVTLAGEVLDPVGVLSGGSHQGVSQGLLAKKREIAELGTAVAELEQKVAVIDAVIAQLGADIEAGEARVRALAEQAHADDLELVRLEQSLSALAGHIERTEARQAVILREHTALGLERERAAHELEQRRVAQTQLAARKATLEDEVAKQAAQVESERAHEAARKDALTAQKVSLAERRERKDALERALSRAGERARELTGRITRLANNLDGAAQIAEQLARQIGDASRERGELEAEATGLRVEVATLDAGVGADRERLRAEDEGLRRARQEADTHRAVEAQASLAAKTAELAREALVRQVEERFQLVLAEVLESLLATAPLGPDEEQRREELRRKIDAMGEINLTAVTEFEEVRERFEFLKQQREDLTRAISMLRGAIRKINQTSEQRFVETFHLVNTKFQAVFPRLFHGGEAKLILDNEKDPLEGGLEMLVQPPGKKLQSANLLSGGEKALTAVALIFSIFLIKPTPFCLLDEVDAPLDDANVGRYNELVRDISSVSQIIVITHNKRTMEVPDRLYGVTMEEPGISRLVGVDIRATEQRLRLVS